MNDTSIRNIYKNPDQLITNILNCTQQPLNGAQRVAPTKDEIAALFQTVGKAMNELVDTLPDSKWKLRYLKLQVQDIARQIKDNASNPEKTFIGLIRRTRTTVNNIFRTLHSSDAGADFICEGDHPVIKKAKKEACRDKKEAQQVWKILEKNMADKKPEVVASIVASGNCFKLLPFQVMQIWDWAGGQFEVIGAILNILWIPPQQLGPAVEQALQKNQFSVIAEPVIAHHFDRLSIPLQKRVHEWAQERFHPSTPASSQDESIGSSTILLDNLHDLASRLVIFIKRIGLTQKEPTRPVGDEKAQLATYIYQINFAFMTIYATDLRTNEKVEKAHALWITLREDLKQDPLPPGIIRKVELITEAVNELPSDFQAREEEFDGADSFVHVSRPSGYGSMDSTSMDKKRAVHLRSEEMFLALKAAFEADDADAFTMDCMGLLLLEQSEFEALFAIACTKDNSLVMERFWTLRPLFYLPSTHLWPLFTIFLNNERYGEAEKIMRFPCFRDIGEKVLSIATMLKPEAPKSLTDLATEVVVNHFSLNKTPFNPLETNIKTLAAFLAQSLLNNGWLEDEPVAPAENEPFQTKALVALIDQLLNAIPKDVQKPAVVNIRTKAWPALRAALEKDFLNILAIQARFDEMMEQMFYFRKPLPDIVEVDADESKVDASDPMPKLVADLRTAVQARNLTAMKREMERLSNNLASITPDALSQIADLMRSIPLEDLTTLAREELGDEVTDDLVSISVGQVFDMITTLKTASAPHREPPVPSGLGEGLEILSDLKTYIQQQNWEAVQKRVHKFFETAAANNRSTIVAIAQLLAPTNLEELKMMITMQLSY